MPVFLKGDKVLITGVGKVAIDSVCCCACPITMHVETNLSGHTGDGSDCQCDQNVNATVGFDVTFDEFCSFADLFSTPDGTVTCHNNSTEDCPPVSFTSGATVQISITAASQGNYSVIVTWSAACGGLPFSNCFISGAISSRDNLSGDQMFIDNFSGSDHNYTITTTITF